MSFPEFLTPVEALARINGDHEDGWEGAPFQDPQRVLACERFVLRRLAIPEALCFGATHPPVVAEYRGLTTPPPPPFFDMDGLVIDGTHRLEACAGRTIAVYIPAGLAGTVHVGNLPPLLVQ
jgi:hypothetical protein